MLRFAPCLALLAAASGCAAPPPPRLQKDLDDFVREQRPGVVCVAYEDLDDGTWATVDADHVLHAASTMKVPVMIEVFRQVDAGELSLDMPVQIKNEFASIVDGSSYELSPEDDSDPDLYEIVGQTRPLGELVERMITKSSNLATNLVIALVDARRVQKTIEQLGTTNTRVLRGVEDIKAYRRGLNNATTARDLAILLTAIVHDEAASAESCRRMITILKAQEDNSMIPAGLPEGTVVAHKTGEITRIHHDAAIVYPKDGHDYVLVVLTANWDDSDASAKVVADVARLVDSER